jgi:hypothetical protein
MPSSYSHGLCASVAFQENTLGSAGTAAPGGVF